MYFVIILATRGHVHHLKDCLKTFQAADSVQGFLQSHPPFKDLNHDDLVLSLDTNCQALDKLLGFFKDLTQGKFQHLSRVVL